MQQLACSIAILAVTVLYLFWRAWLQATHRRTRLRRERVAYMLWVLADVDEAALAAWSPATIDNTLDVT